MIEPMEIGKMNSRYMRINISEFDIMIPRRRNGGLKPRSVDVIGVIGRFVAENEIAVIGVREEVGTREERGIIARDGVAVAVALFHLKPNSIFGCVFCGARLFVAIMNHSVSTSIYRVPVGFEKSRILFVVGGLNLDTVDILFHFLLLLLFLF